MSEEQEKKGGIKKPQTITLIGIIILCIVLLIVFKYKALFPVVILAVVAIAIVVNRSILRKRKGKSTQEVKQVNLADSDKNKFSQYFVSRDETYISSLGNGYIANFLANGSLSKGFAVITNKRVYFRGSCYSGQGKSFVKSNEERTVDIKDVTGSGFIYRRYLGVLLGLVVALVVLLAGIGGSIGLALVEWQETVFYQDSSDSAQKHIKDSNSAKNQIEKNEKEIEKNKAVIGELQETIAKQQSELQTKQGEYSKEQDEKKQVYDKVISSLVLDSYREPGFDIYIGEDIYNRYQTLLLDTEVSYAYDEYIRKLHDLFMQSELASKLLEVREGVKTASPQGVNGQKVRDYILAETAFLESSSTVNKNVLFSGESGDISKYLSGRYCSYEYSYGHSLSGYYPVADKYDSTFYCVSEYSTMDLIGAASLLAESSANIGEDYEYILENELFPISIIDCIDSHGSWFWGAGHGEDTAFYNQFNEENRQACTELYQDFLKNIVPTLNVSAEEDVPPLCQIMKSYAETHPDVIFASVFIMPNDNENANQTAEWTATEEEISDAKRQIDELLNSNNSLKAENEELQKIVDNENQYEKHYNEASKEALYSFVFSGLLTAFAGALITFLISCFLVFLDYLKKRKTMFQIQYAGGCIAFDVSYYAKAEIDDFQKQLRRTKDYTEEVGQRTTPVAPPIQQERVQSSQSNAPEDLRKYAELLKDGLISQEDYDAMKKKILGL